MSIFNIALLCKWKMLVLSYFSYYFLLILNTSCPVEYIVSDMLGTEKCYRKWDTIKKLVGLLQKGKSITYKSSNGISSHNFLGSPFVLPKHFLQPSLLYTWLESHYHSLGQSKPSSCYMQFLIFISMYLNLQNF